MIVLDASVVIDFVLREASVADIVDERLAREAQLPVSPHLMDVEVAHGVRRLLRTGEIVESQALLALESVAHLRILRYPHYPYLQQAFALRDNLTMYDAVYIALAAELDATLLTRDGRLARTPGLPVPVEVIE